MIIRWPGLELDRGNQGHCLPLLGFGLDALRPLSTLRAFFTTSGPWCLFVTLPVALVLPKNKNPNSRPEDGNSVTKHTSSDDDRGG